MYFKFLATKKLQGPVDPGHSLNMPGLRQILKTEGTRHILAEPSFPPSPEAHAASQRMLGMGADS